MLNCCGKMWILKNKRQSAVLDIKIHVAIVRFRAGHSVALQIKLYLVCWSTNCGETEYQKFLNI